MKNVFYIIIVLFISANFTSCTPESIIDNAETPQACCDEGGHIPPPPPPPPPTGGGITGD